MGRLRAVSGAPVDHSLPLPRVTDANGKILALVINYACHNESAATSSRSTATGRPRPGVDRGRPSRAVAMVTLGCAPTPTPVRTAPWNCASVTAGPRPTR